MKAIWKGSIACGLVTIDVQLFSAIKEHAIGFSLLHATCKNPIRYKRWCTHCNKEVSWDETVKGFKISPTEYVILTKEVLARFKPEKSSLITLKYFIDTYDIPQFYFNNHYYVAPGEGNEHAYLLFTQTLAKLTKTGIGTFVFKEKDHVCALTAYGSLLVLSTLHYAYEVQPAHKIKAIQFSTKEITLAENIIDSLTEKKFDITSFKDTFVQKLAANIKKARRTKILPPVKKEKKALTKAEKPSLMSSLEETVKKLKSRKRIIKHTSH